MSQNSNVSEFKCLRMQMSQSSNVSGFKCLRIQISQNVNVSKCKYIKVNKVLFFTGFEVQQHVGDTTTAQLIADSTEKKFNFNPFKGKKLFKKKQYSFDFN